MIQDMRDYYYDYVVSVPEETPDELFAAADFARNFHDMLKQVKISYKVPPMPKGDTNIWAAIESGMADVTHSLEDALKSLAEESLKLACHRELCAQEMIDNEYDDSIYGSYADQVRGQR